MKISLDTSVSNIEYKKTPLWNESLPLEERLSYLIQELTIEEKIQCLTMRAPDIERLGIKSFTLGTEAAHGVEARHDQKFNKGLPINTTIFTQPIGMSTTWDKDLIKKAGMVVGTEARAIYKEEGNTGLSCWAPTIDMERDPRWGRNEEGYGEDPYLTGEMSSAYIKGIQGQDSFYLRCGTTLKHFYANNEEQDREFSSSSLDIRNKHEYYLEPFRRAIVEGKAEAVMTSYNEINGIPAIVNNEVQELLKDQWGLKGHVVCDMRDLAQTVTKHNYFETDAETLTVALKTGIDAFNDPEETVIAAANEALEKGLITEEDINRAITNTFSTKIRLGIYDAKDTCPYSDIDSNRLNCQEHKEICLEVAKKSMVLLKNENQVLPLSNSTQEAIAVVGPLADVWNKDWYSGLPSYYVTPYEGIKKEFPHANLSFSDAIDHIRIKIGECYLAVAQDGSCYLSEKKDAEVFQHSDWGDNRHTLRALSINKFLFADTDLGSIVANKAEVFSWFVQEVFAFDEVIGEKGDKTDKLTFKCWDQKPVCIDDEGKLIITDEGSKSIKATEFIFELILDGIQHAVEMAHAADKIIAVVGCHPIISSKEGVDRLNLSLPSYQRKLLQAIKQVNPNIILVLITNYPYIIDWEQENLPAILTTASGSQEIGSAIAKAISGDYSPAGRLNMTWYLGEEQLPPMRDYDIIQGKRTYQYFDGKVLYPFGYGLSYSEFSYHDMSVTKEPDRLKIKLLVKNIGHFDSDEVVQLYVSQLYSRTRRPMNQLKGFERVRIKAGEEVELQFDLRYDELKYYDVVTGSMVLEDSDYQIQIGTSSKDILLKTDVHVDGIKIMNRDMRKRILCDHYDNYNNLYLHRGHDGKPCMLPMVAEVEEEKLSMLPMAAEVEEVKLSMLPMAAEVEDGQPYMLPMAAELEDGMPCMLSMVPVVEDGQLVKGSAVYQDACFDFLPKRFVIDIKAEEAGNIQVWLGAIKIVTFTVDIMENFKVIEIPIDATGIMIGEKNPLHIEIQGKIRVVEFGFKD